VRPQSRDDTVALRQSDELTAVSNSVAAHRFHKVGERSCVIRLRARYGSKSGRAVIAGGDNSVRIRAKARAIDRCTMHEQHSKILADLGELGEAYQNRISLAFNPRLT